VWTIVGDCGAMLIIIFRRPILDRGAISVFNVRHCRLAKGSGGDSVESGLSLIVEH